MQDLVFREFPKLEVTASNSASFSIQLEKFEGKLEGAASNSASFSIRTDKFEGKFEGTASNSASNPVDVKEQCQSFSRQSNGQPLRV